MCLNLSKCELLCISNKRSPVNSLYYISSHNLQWVSSVKYLGVFVDSKLSWNNHVSHVSDKATKVLNLLHRHMYTCRTSSKHKAFRALVLPVLDYASVVWNPHTNKNISTDTESWCPLPIGILVQIQTSHLQMIQVLRRML